MIYRCEFCKTEWDSRELSHHPQSQEWMGGKLVACPYCFDEQEGMEQMLALMQRDARHSFEQIEHF